MFFKKPDVQKQTTWSEKMVKEFIESCFSLSSLPGTLPLIIKERIIHQYFNLNKSKYDISIGYIGLLLKGGFNDVCFCLSAMEEPIEVFPGCIGFLELLNGRSEDGAHVPMIRGFIKRDVELFEAVDALMKDSKIFNSANSMCLHVHVDLAFMRDLDPENILNKKLGIRNVDLYQRLTI